MFPIVPVAPRTLTLDLPSFKLANLDYRRRMAEKFPI